MLCLNAEGATGGCACVTRMCYTEKATKARHRQERQKQRHNLVQWSEDKIKADPFFGRSWVRFRVRPWVSNTIARDHLA